MRTNAIVGLNQTEIVSPFSASTAGSNTSVAAPERVTFDDARENVRAATAELVDAIRSLTGETRPVVSAMIVPSVEPAASTETAASIPVSADTDVEAADAVTHRSASRSELFAALGMAAAAMHGAHAQSRVVRTEGGVEVVNNAGEVSARAAAAIKKLNAALAQVAGLRSMSPDASQQVEQAIRAALALIAASGIEGITANPSSSNLQVDFAPAKVTDSLVRQAAALAK
jgi:hypothetical protein